MNVILKQGETEQKSWYYEEKEKGLKYDNDLIITDKRIIHQRDLVNSHSQRLITRTDLPLESIKSFSASYQSKTRNFWLFVCIITAILAVFAAALLMTYEQAFLGICIGVVLVVASVFSWKFYRNPDRSPIPVKQSRFYIIFQTKEVEGEPFILGGGSVDALQGKRNWLSYIPFFGLLFMKRRGKKISVPEEMAREIIETIGSLIF